MKATKTKATLAGFACAAALLATAAPVSAAGPAFRLGTLSNSSAAPGQQIEYPVQLTNTGDAETSGEITFTASLPTGLTAVSAFDIEGHYACDDGAGNPVGSGDLQTVRCTTSTPLLIPSVSPAESSSVFLITAEVANEPALLGQTKTPTFTASGGGAATVVSADPTTISASPLPFGIDAFDAKIEADESGAPLSAAGAHPYAIASDVGFTTAQSDVEAAKGFGLPVLGLGFPVEAPRDVSVDLPAGLVGNPNGIAQCTALELSYSETIIAKPFCPSSSQVGTAIVRTNGTLAGKVDVGPIPIFNMQPPTGSAVRFGFNVLGVVVVLDGQLRSNGGYHVAITARNISEGLAVPSSTLTFWGVPGDEAHKSERACPGQVHPGEGGATCAGSGSEAPFLRMPTSCTEAGLPWDIATDSWVQPGAELSDGTPDLSDPKWKTGSMSSHQLPGFPFAPSEWGADVGVEDCESVPVRAELDASPTAIDTETSTGLDVHVEIPGASFDQSSEFATESSDIKAVKVTLPQGVTINASQAEGLGVCSPAQYASTELSFHPDGSKGCPSDSKIGSVEVHTPILAETLPGSVYVAKPYDNPFNSLLALYIVIEEPERGILVKLPGEVRTNEVTGQIETEFKDLPQTPFESFDFKFREGARAPLVTPPACGTYTTTTEFTGWSDPTHKVISKSDFQIVHGIGGAPCPAGGVPGFKPGFSAGSTNNAAGAYSPFNMRLTRSDAEQDMTRFSAVLPPGVLGKLAGVDKCPESAIAAAKAKSGLQEIASPSCPANSQIGRSLVGAGVGSVLAYVPGKIYLGGPFNGDPLSVIAITPAVAGPFDVGTVVVHEALTLNPKSAEVEVDGAASDPIPHILKGIPAKVRDVRVYVDRQSFTLNPTSCDPSSARATLFGSYADVFNPADDVPVALSDRYQAASCQSLGFKPHLALRLRGGTRRGAHPALTATYRPRPGDANLSDLTVRLPRSAFLEQGHIRTVCTRVQFAAKACPKGAQYGYIRAWTPLLDEPLQGPVYLRSSNHRLPDLVFDLHGLVDVEVAARIDSAHGGIRARVEAAPDAPISKVILKMQGAKKGLIVNSRDLCTAPSRATVEFDGQNGKAADSRPLLRPSCPHRPRHAK